jgi:erythromycin esterase-like protein
MLRNAAVPLDGSPGDYDASWSSSSTAGSFQELNLGAHARAAHGPDSVLVGCTTHGGSVTAATEWGGDASLQLLRPALPESWGALFHETGVPVFLLPLRTDVNTATAISEPRLQRLVGVVYERNSERASHYYETVLGRQYDAVIHIDRTNFVQPLPADRR